jgi:hypothetical protein
MTSQPFTTAAIALHTMRPAAPDAAVAAAGRRTALLATCALQAGALASLAMRSAPIPVPLPPAVVVADLSVAMNQVAPFAAALREAGFAVRVVPVAREHAEAGTAQAIAGVAGEGPAPVVLGIGPAAGAAVLGAPRGSVAARALVAPDCAAEAVPGPVLVVTSAGAPCALATAPGVQHLAFAQPLAMPRPDGTAALVIAQRAERHRAGRDIARWLASAAELQRAD